MGTLHWNHVFEDVVNVEGAFGESSTGKRNLLLYPESLLAIQARFKNQRVAYCAEVILPLTIFGIQSLALLLFCFNESADLITVALELLLFQNHELMHYPHW